MNHILPDLSYSYNDLEPYFDTETMTIHHVKHHQTYIDNLNKALENTVWSNFSIYELMTKLPEISIDKRTIVRNNGGGHINHSLFWKNLKIGTLLPITLKTAIEQSFGSIEQFKEKFEQIAMSHFGSGWIWVVKDNEMISIVTTVNQDNPIMGKSISGVYGMPILGLDLWEHAYYLHYKNKKIDYIKSFWNVVNWNEVLRRFEKNISDY
ncbi:Fe-Mn family superoxide dismutase [Buchnera aphidicola (Formosaphis micheliae)]|uniref:Fe-Mn family superoxide dismutase n=1 Tax=Buchnera aphidicola TaxID=9 RepID=UPI0031CCC5AB